MIQSKEKELAVVIANGETEDKETPDYAKGVVENFLLELESLHSQVGSEKTSLQSESVKEVCDSQEVAKNDLVTKSSDAGTCDSSGWLTETKTFRSTSLLEQFDKTVNHKSPISGTESVTSDAGKVVISPSYFQLLSVEDEVEEAEEAADILEEGEIRNAVKVKDRKAGTQQKRAKKTYQLGRSKNLKALSIKVQHKKSSIRKI